MTESGELGAVTAYHIDASPALAVQHAMNTIFVDRWPDLLVSGVNYGENLGMDITISGTVGAAFQAAVYGIAAIAASQESAIAHHYEYGEMNWDGSVRVVRKYAQILLDRVVNHPSFGAPAGPGRLAEPRAFPFDVLKIDVPMDLAADAPERLCRLARRHYFRHTIPEPNAESPLKAGRTWIDSDPAHIKPGTDIHAFAVERLPAITPLSLDFTADLGASGAALGVI